MDEFPRTVPASEPPPLSANPGRPGVCSGLGTVALYFGFQLAFSLLLLFVGVVIWAVVQGMHQHTPTMPEVMQLVTSPRVMTLLTVVATVLSAALIAFCVWRFWPHLWRQADPPGFGLVRPTSGWWYAGAVVIGGVMVVLVGLLTQWLAHGQEFNQDVTELGRSVGPGMRIVLGLLVVLVAPLVEELLFRGVLLSGLLRRMGTSWAVLLSALVFGCAHGADFKFAWYPLPGLALLGVVLALLRLKSRSLWVPVTAHATNNLLGVIVWFVAANAHA